MWPETVKQRSLYRAQQMTVDMVKELLAQLRNRVGCWTALKVDRDSEEETGF